MEVHVVSKHDNSKHASFTIPASARLENLSETSVRVRPQIISLTSNNLTYARMGTMLNWWDSYPVHGDYPAPYNDASEWGIAPAWGFATVEETNISELAPGTLLYGFWPTSAALTDLQLTKGTPEGHWIETSDHRKKLMPLYNRYKITPKSISIDSLSAGGSASPADAEELNQLAWSSIPLTCGYHMNENVFPNHPERQKPVHPLGSPLNLPWSDEDGDLSSAVVVSLGASTKTARSFAYFLERRQKKTAPLGFLQVTSTTAGISKATETASPSFPSKAIEYTNVTSDRTVEWFKQLKASKVIILEFGARENVIQKLVTLFKENTELGLPKLVIIKIGSPQKLLSNEDLIASRDEMADLGIIQLNTSGIQDAVIDSLGAEAFFAGLEAGCHALIQDRHQWAPDLKLVWGHGVRGNGGIEGGWDRLCRSDVRAEETLVYRLQALGTNAQL